jgi:hypothetical protein
MFSILAKAVKLLCILIHSIVTLLKLALRSSEQGRTNAENLASTALTHASASRGSSALVKVGGFIPINWE